MSNHNRQNWGADWEDQSHDYDNAEEFMEKIVANSLEFFKNHMKQDKYIAPQRNNESKLVSKIQHVGNEHRSQSAHQNNEIDDQKLKNMLMAYSESPSVQLPVKLSGQNVNIQPNLPTYPQNQAFQVDAELLENLQRSFLYEVDVCSENYKAKWGKTLEQCQQIVRYFYNNRIKPQDFLSGLQISEKRSLTGIILQERFIMILKTAFRKLQALLLLNYNKSIISLSQKDVRILLQKLMRLDCLSDDHFDTLARLMKVSFDLPSKVQEKELFQFYCHCLFLVQQKCQADCQKPLLFVGETRLSSKLLEQQTQLIKLYLDNNPPSQIKQILLDKFSESPNLQPFKTIDFQIIFQRLLKKSLIRLSQQYNKIDSKRLYPLRLKWKQCLNMFRSPQGHQLRRSLLKMSISKYFFLPDVFRIIEMIESSLEEYYQKESMRQKARSNIKIQQKQKSTKPSKRQKRSNQVDLNSSQSDRITTRGRKQRFLQSESLSFDDPEQQQKQDNSEEQSDKSNSQDVYRPALTKAAQMRRLQSRQSRKQLPSNSQQLTLRDYYEKVEQRSLNTYNNRAPTKLKINSRNPIRRKN